jgi:hypothetical protein
MEWWSSEKKNKLWKLNITKQAIDKLQKFEIKNKGGGGGGIS